MKSNEEIMGDKRLLVSKSNPLTYQGYITLSNNKQGTVIASRNESGWEHVSICLFKGKLPTWEDMCEVKDIFWDDEEQVVQIHPRNTKAKDEGIKYEVIEKCGVISEGKNGWTTELRYIAWNDGEPKYDIRSWVTNEDGTEKCGKGITLTGEQLESLGNILSSARREVCNLRRL